jgi:hypothetical protein
MRYFFSLPAIFLLCLMSTSRATAQTTGSWTQVDKPPGATLKQISVGNADAIWGLDTAGFPWKWNGAAWSKKPGTVASISVASDGTLWATNPPDGMRVLRFDSDRGVWGTNSPTGMKQVTAVSSSKAWGLDNNGTLFAYTPGFWDKKVGSVTQISVGADGTLWAINRPDSNRVLRWTGSSWDASPGAGKVFVSVGSADNIWTLDSSDNVFKWNGSSWQQMPGKLRNIAAAGDGTVWGLDASGSVFKWAAAQAPTGNPSTECIKNISQYGGTIPLAIYEYPCTTITWGSGLANKPVLYNCCGSTITLRINGSDWDRLVAAGKLDGLRYQRITKENETYNLLFRKVVGTTPTTIEATDFFK